MSFPRSYRLITKFEFKTVFDEAFKLNQFCLTVLFRSNQKDHARIGIIVGKRVAKKAVSRNRIKRVVRDSFRLNQQKLAGWDIIVIARQRCDTLSKKIVRKGIDDLWEKLLIRYQNRLSF
ncbi:MAG TPA: ribonuclease P protein component [Gammaproteobacteria bacterium]|nr:ribonuclease P protein component [Gammaproteobacteria bacterium]